ncbi:unnamed protein product, partial [marine sediment metagenome]
FQYPTMITVEKADAAIVVVQDQVLYNSSLGLEIKLESEFGNPLPNQPLLIRINSTIYTVYTDINGSVIIDMSNYLLGNYSITIDFTGSNNYETASFIGTIEIIPQQTQMKLVEKGEQWAIYLLDSENRSLSNREITIEYLTENGTILHTETYRTDSNGLIIFEILSKAFLSKSEYLVFNFRGDSYYNACEYMFDLVNLGINPNKTSTAVTLIIISVSMLIIVCSIGLVHLLRRKKWFCRK